MKILSIETSCDETAAGVIEDGAKILSNVVASSKELHEKTGGIIPEIAAREQVRCIIPVINETMRQCNNVTMNNIDAIAVTVGPGLNGSLLVGIETAKTIAYITGKPIVPVNHIFAHIYANFLSGEDTSGVAEDIKTPRGWPNACLRRQGLREGELRKVPQFPAIALVVSGGHTELFLMKSHEKIKWLGGTLDDAAGEAFDKTARLLGLGFPGGPAIAAAAAEFRIQNSEFRIRLPRPMIDSDDLNLSFSGLKTAVLREFNKLQSLKKLNDEIIQQLSYEIQESITDVLVHKTIKAAQEYKVKSILLGGGVAANSRLTEKFKLKIKNLKLKIELYIPPPPFCTDNAAYIGSYAYFHNHPLPWQKIQAQPNLTVEV